jgi:hypothetical protein
MADCKVDVGDLLSAPGTVLNALDGAPVKEGS